MKQYYYLVSSLYDLILDSGKKVISIRDFLGFCGEELAERDYFELKKLFLFNDIKNAVNFKKRGDKYLTPAFYDEEEFLENLKDIDSFLPFLNDFYYNINNNKKNDSNLDEIDDLTLLFYENLDVITSKFIKEYFLFELNLKNISVAYSLRKNGIDFKNKIIPFGDSFENILKNNSPDFGLSNEFQFIERLMAVYEKNDLIEIEKTLEDIRWNYLDTICENEFFSINNIYSYTIKLLSVERWLSLSKERGEEFLNRLIDQIKGNIKFPDEFR